MTTSNNETLTIGRFAPSPTGPLHLGSLVAALGSYLMTKRCGGLWLLRMEDLDLPRVVAGVADDMLATLESLGFEWDGEIVYQSRRGDYYREIVDRLVERELVYPCGCSRTEIAQVASAPHDAALVYPGTCRNGLSAHKTARALRVRVADETVTFADLVMGASAQDLGRECGDFVIQRADGPFAYHLAVVVDDAAAGVNQVVRGADLLTSTPRQIYLQRLLGLPTPQYGHLPLVIGGNGGKLSKRENAVSLAAGRDLRREGGKLLVSALRFLGQKPPADLERGAPSEILQWGVANFDPAAVPRVSASFHL
ncbi:tRNA glutamyl-Q(34) synthetase GluQRS [Geomonas sp. RF6]|nr:tRNA glutamyl-Q(34) synthetase GluQRS [Geomonas sp. RF6]UFS69280.1 tRNA glutamyl-Q(34) synthetase GluQRS [Geomonas sp. RF6]